MDWIKNPFVMSLLGAGVFAAGIGIPLASGKSVDRSKSVSEMTPKAHVESLGRTDLDSLQQHEATLVGIADIVSQAVVNIKSLNQQGEGSGFIYRPDGWIVTNQHVVGDSEEVTVVLKDGRELKGKVIGADDQQIDLAVVKIDRKDLPFLNLANSDETKVGQMAIAVGAPFGLENTVTIGHVSALGRGSSAYDPRVGARDYTGLIQTDAAINPGNSGGPLINTNSEVIGVNSTILSTTQASAGIGFAIPSNVVKAVADELIATGKFDRGLIGAFITDPKPYQLEDRKLEAGVLVEDIQPDGPASRAGIQKGDFITKLDGEKLWDEMDLRIALYEKSPGDEVSVSYIRAGKEKTSKVKLSQPQVQVAQNNTPQQRSPLEEFPFPFGERDQGNSQIQPPTQQGRVRLGVSIREIDETMRAQFDLPESAQGVLVVTVAPDSFAESVGLIPGDLIKEINGTKVSSPVEIGQVLAKVSWGDQVTIKYSRYEEGSSSDFSISQPIG